jgi:hypothetical protein
MTGDQLSLILLPTNKCNVACECCFEDKTADFMTLDQLAVVIDKLHWPVRRNRRDSHVLELLSRKRRRELC